MDRRGLEEDNTAFGAWITTRSLEVDVVFTSIMVSSEEILLSVKVREMFEDLWRSVNLFIDNKMHRPVKDPVGTLYLPGVG